jgi:cell division protein FtsL
MESATIPSNNANAPLVSTGLIATTRTVALMVCATTTVFATRNTRNATATRVLLVNCVAISKN